jgi:hypothetical protein
MPLRAMYTPRLISDGIDPRCHAITDRGRSRGYHSRTFVYCYYYSLYTHLKKGSTVVFLDGISKTATSSRRLSHHLSVVKMGLTHLRTSHKDNHKDTPRGSSVQTVVTQNRVYWSFGIGPLGVFLLIYRLGFAKNRTMV